MSASAGAILETRRLDAAYGPTRVLQALDLAVPAGGIVTLLGANGAGKTTTLRAICNMMVRSAGEIHFNGQRIDGRATEDIVRLGIGHVPDGRGTFVSLSVEENLRLGAYTRRDRGVAQDLERVYGYFPRLKERRHSQSGYTSGGEQQMTAIGRALMARPQLILLDEPSMGLAPQLVEEIFNIVKELNEKERVSFLLAEQNTHMALRYADYGYILENGRVVMDGEAHALAENEDVKEFYLGFSTAGRKSFRDVKSYRRRKRWL
jgi:branched-chain amino acid transport system ATP-binding protein